MYRIDVVRHFCLHWSLNMVLIVWNKFVQKRPSLELFPYFHPPQYYYIINISAVTLSARFFHVRGWLALQIGPPHQYHYTKVGGRGGDMNYAINYHK